MSLGKWPTRLHQLVNEESDDLWEAVKKRIHTNPEELAVSGKAHLQTPLHQACYRYPPESVVRDMLNVNSSIASLQNREGETPLHIAVQCTSELVQMMLLGAAKDAVSKVDIYGETPLHLACAAGSSVPLFRKIVEADPHVVNVKNKKGLTPFFVLSQGYEHAKVVSDISRGGQYADDWVRAMILLRASHFGTLDIPKNSRVKVLHAAAGAMCPRVFLKAVARLFPMQSLQQDEHGRVPLAIAAMADEFVEPEIDDAFSVESDSDEAGSCEEGVKSEINKCRKSSQRDEETVMDFILNLNPLAAMVTDNNGRFPLTHALVSGKRWDRGVKRLVFAAPSLLHSLDPKERLLPFMIAAVGDRNHLDTVYRLIRILPEVVQRGISQDNVDSMMDNAEISQKQSKRCYESAEDCVQNRRSPKMTRHL